MPPDATADDYPGRTSQVRALADQLDRVRFSPRGSLGTDIRCAARRSASRRDGLADALVPALALGTSILLLGAWLFLLWRSLLAW